MDPLAVAVVLGHRVGAAPVDAAGDLAVGVLELGEPLREIARNFGVAEAEEGDAGQRAVADPGAGVGARAGLDRRAVAVDEDGGEAGAEGAQERLGLGRQAQLDAVEARAPGGAGGSLEGGEAGGVDRGGGGARGLKRSR